MIKPVILVIMDGWGKGVNKKEDAIANAHTPFVDKLYNQYPHSELVTCGEDVGLPEGQMGNSEVGHLNIGAGRIVYQELQRINLSVKDGTLAKNEILNQEFKRVIETGCQLHFIGLVSDGGVHSHISHLKALSKMAKDAGVPKHFIHAFTDGRDTNPKSGLSFLKQLNEQLQETSGTIASVTGRFYAMDRDKRWERVKTAYDALVRGTGIQTQDILNAVEDQYKHGIYDEFIIPVIAVDENNKAISVIKEGDAAICFNFRTDRCREITIALTQQSFPEFDMHPLNLHYVTMTEYDPAFKNVNVLFSNDNLTHTIGSVLSDNGIKQVRAAETEKYPHITFFFSGGQEALFEGETRLLVNSPKEVLTYDLKPEMSARELTQKLLPVIEDKTAGFMVINFANADMVGHTGNWEAVIKAVETVDSCVGQITKAALENGYSVFLTADHGNADYMKNDDGSPNTAHSLNKVPLFIITQGDELITLKNGKLGDIAPTILHFMGLRIPDEMTGNVLI